MQAFLTFIHVGTCVLLVLVVLLQSGRGGGLSVFGGGGGDLFATPTTTSFMKQLTYGLAATFGLTALVLTLLAGRIGMHSVTRTAPLAFPASPAGGRGAPAAPGAAAPAPAEKGAPAKAPAKKTAK